MAQLTTGSPTPYVKPRRRVLHEMRQEWTAYLFQLPGLLLFAVFTAGACSSTRVSSLPLGVETYARGAMTVTYASLR